MGAPNLPPGSAGTRCAWAECSQPAAAECVAGLVPLREHSARWRPLCTDHIRVEAAHVIVLLGPHGTVPESGYGFAIRPLRERDALDGANLDPALTHIEVGQGLVPDLPFYTGQPGLPAVRVSSEQT